MAGSHVATFDLSFWDSATWHAFHEITTLSSKDIPNIKAEGLKCPLTSAVSIPQVNAPTIG